MDSKHAGLLREHASALPKASSSMQLYEQIALRESLIIGAKAIDSNRKLVGLLCEWRKTPFFDDANKWEEWVRDFGRRVDEAIGSEETE